MRTHLDLFSGIGGFSIASEMADFRTVAFCEIDPEASLVLSHWWPDVPNLRDVKTITKESYDLETPYLITGGVPCQPASALGLMRGTSDPRWMWPDTIRIVSELRPRFAVFENPPAILTLESGGAFNGIVSGLSALGYDLWWDIISAASIGAGHLRERLFLVCSDSESRETHQRESGDVGSAERRGEGVHASAHAVREDASDAAGISKRKQADAENSIASGRQTRNESRSSSEGDPNPNGSGWGAGMPRRSSCDSERPPESALQMERPHADKQRRGKARDRIREGTPEAIDLRREPSPPSLRGRVNGPGWWHEDNTGIPVLVNGISAKLAESYHRCAGNAVVPQAAFQILNALP